MVLETRFMYLFIYHNHVSGYVFLYLKTDNAYRVLCTRVSVHKSKAKNLKAL